MIEVKDNIISITRTAEPSICSVVNDDVDSLKKEFDGYGLEYREADVETEVAPNTKNIVPWDNDEHNNNFRTFLAVNISKEDLAALQNEIMDLQYGKNINNIKIVLV